MRTSGIFLVIGFIASFAAPRAHAQSGSRTNGFFEFQGRVPAEMVEADVSRRLVSVDTVTIGEFPLGGSGGRQAPAALARKIEELARTQKPGEIDFVVGWADTTRWDRGRYDPLVDYAADVATANARAVWALGIEKAAGAQARLLIVPGTGKDLRAVVVYRAQYAEVAPLDGKLILISRNDIPVSVAVARLGSEGPKTTCYFSRHDTLNLRPGSYVLDAAALGYESERSFQEVLPGGVGGIIFDLKKIPPKEAKRPYNLFDDTRLYAGADLTGFITPEDGPNGAPAVSIGLESRHWTVSFTAGGWGFHAAPAWFDSTGNRALRVMTTELSIYPVQWFGVSGGFSWCDDVVLKTTKATKTWYGPIVGVKLRWRAIGGSPLSLVFGLDGAYLLHTDYNAAGSEWRIGVVPELKLTYSF